MKIRKQVYELTLVDLQRFPVWEFCLDEEGEEGQDEATVRPYPVTGPLNLSGGMIVRAAFTLADGGTLWGCITPPAREEAALDALQPVIVTDAGQVMFWYALVPCGEKQLAESYAKLGRGAPAYFQFA